MKSGASEQMQAHRLSQAVAVAEDRIRTSHLLWLKWIFFFSFFFFFRPSPHPQSKTEKIDLGINVFVEM